jgi:hypothetical protein
MATINQLLKEFEKILGPAPKPEKPSKPVRRSQH